LSGAGEAEAEAEMALRRALLRSVEISPDRKVRPLFLLLCILNISIGWIH